MRRQLGAFDNSPAIAYAVDSVLLSRTTTPSRSRAQTASHPSRYRGQQNSPSNGLLFRIAADSIGLCGRAPAHYPMLKNSDFASITIEKAAGSLDVKVFRGSADKPALPPATLTYALP